MYYLTQAGRDFLDEAQYGEIDRAGLERADARKAASLKDRKNKPSTGSGKSGRGTSASTWDGAPPPERIAGTARMRSPSGVIRTF